MKQQKTARRSVKIAVFLIMVGLSAVFSLLAKFIFPEVDASSIVISSGTDPAVSETSHATGNGSPAVPAATPDMIPVYLVGAIKHPGVYLVIRGSYLYELVDKAGGLTSDAAVREINLAFRLDANQRIVVPTVEEIKSSQPVDLLISGSTSPRLVDLNQAGQDELESLPGIGPATARAILDYRARHGLFAKIEDLMKVPGIKDSRFESLKDLICVAGSP
jgi:competence protein ComEA